MKRNVRLFLCALAVTIGLISLTGVTFSYLQQTDYKQEADIYGDMNIVLMENTDAADESIKIKPGEAVKREVYVVNAGSEDCYVRVKVAVPEVEGIRLFQLGKLENKNFTETILAADGAIAGQDTEHWERSGEYLYYRNTKTGNRLTAGNKTPYLYEAVRLSADINAGNLAFAGGYNQDILVCAEAVPADLYKNQEEAFAEHT